MPSEQIDRLYKSGLAGLFGGALGYWIGAGVKATIIDAILPGVTYLAGQGLSRTEAGVTGALLAGSLAAYAVYAKWFD